VQFDMICSFRSLHLPLYRRQRRQLIQRKMKRLEDNEGFTWDELLIEDEDAEAMYCSELESDSE